MDGIITLIACLHSVSVQNLIIQNHNQAHACMGAEPLALSQNL